MDTAEPIAIIGRGCVLPGCLTPDALWQAIINDQNLLTRHRDSLGNQTLQTGQAINPIGGYIQGFDEVFDHAEYSLTGIDVKALDAVVKWPLHAVLNAWQEACEPEADSNRIGVVLANLSYPTQGKADYACGHWINGRSDTSMLNAFNSGLPAQLIACALNASGSAFSLDAACASSLYALQIACRKLQQGQLDVAVVSAVNAAHDVMLQHGFSALQALSPTGRSQPFAASADGLVPAQGAAAVVLKRLRDVSNSEQVFGVIRAVGLSNDGRRGGFLVPDAQGQLEAMHNAYSQCDVNPDTIDYLECHATGTPVGDSVEIRTASEFYANCTRLPVGSLKSNTGHLITVAGLASLLKLTLALEHDTLPPTRIDGALNASFEGSKLYPQTQCAQWPSNKIRRAAISNFGFGGNNAHLILEEHSSATCANKGNAGAAPEFNTTDNNEALDRLVVCAVGALAGNDRGTDRIVRRLMCSPNANVGRCTSITLDPLSLRTPPADLQHIEPQQLALLAVVDDALQQLDIVVQNGDANETSKPALQASRVGVFAGMGCASDACRWLLREQLANHFGDYVDDASLELLKDRVVAPITAADVLGAMPNMPANRINAAYDFRSQGYSVSAEELSDVMALQVGCEALKAHDIDMAVICAADFASEPVRSTALKARAADKSVPNSALNSAPNSASNSAPNSASQSSTDTNNGFTDKACALLLMRESTADALGVTVLGYIDQQSERYTSEQNSMASSDPYQSLIKRVYGSAPITDTLFSMVVATALASRGQAVFRQTTEPRLADNEVLGLQFIVQSALPGENASVLPWTLELAPAKATPDLLRPTPYLFYASANSNQQLYSLIKQRVIGGVGLHRVAVVADSQAQLDERLEQVAVLLSGATATDNVPEGVYLGSGDTSGETAFVFTGSAAAYPRMGRGLLMAFPMLAKPAGKVISNCDRCCSSIIAIESQCL